MYPMLWRQLRLAWLPFVAFIICTSVAVGHRGTTEGSAISGYIDHGHYFLSLGHGAYQQTDVKRFASIRRDELIVMTSLVVALASALLAAYQIRRAGLPIR